VEAALLVNPERKDRILNKFESEMSHDDMVYLDHYNEIRWNMKLKNWLEPRFEVHASEIKDRLNEYLSEKGLAHISTEYVITLLQRVRSRHQSQKTGEMLDHEEVW